MWVQQVENSNMIYMFLMKTWESFWVQETPYIFFGYQKVHLLKFWSVYGDTLGGKLHPQGIKFVPCKKM